MRKERQAFNRLWNFVYPPKHCCPKGLFFLLSAHFLLVLFPKRIIVFLIFLNIEF